jgi:hypothetical protein
MTIDAAATPACANETAATSARGKMKRRPGEVPRPPLIKATKTTTA